MEPTQRRTWWWSVAWLLIWGGVSSVWCLTAAGDLGATFDELVDLANGLDFWRTGGHWKLLRLGAMPLPSDLGSLPIYLWERAHGVEVDLRHGDQTVFLWWARSTMLVFWWLLLTYAMIVGTSLAGPWAGRLAVAFLACEPTLLAHACLANKDLAVTACLLAFVYHFRAGRGCSWRWRVGLPALWYGIALLAKASALAFGPLCMVAIELERLARERSATATEPLSWRARLGRGWQLTKPLRRDSVQIVLLGMVLTFLYCGSDWRTQPSFVAWAHSLPEGAWRQPMIGLAENLPIFSNAGEALVRQIAHNMRGHGVYILGASNLRALWYYFPVALTIKLTLPLLILPLLVAILKPRALLNWACVAGVVLLAYSLNCRVQIGIRLILPLLALLVVGLAAALVQCWRDSRGVWKRGLVTAAVVISLGWTSLSSLQVWPHALCYTNELYGGTEQGYLCLSDSNYDWGQGLKDLARWQQGQGIERLRVCYFGTDPIFQTLPMEPIWLGQADDPNYLPDHALGDYLAVSTTVVYGYFPDKESRSGRDQLMDLLEGYEPVARTQTFLIYDLRHHARLKQSHREQ